ncbi:hypothetical protein PG984_006201 [Apiospora sp. TS-2023a]
MRFNARNLILGLAALGSIPEGLGRAIPGSDAVALYQRDGFLHARVVVEPVHIGSGGGKGSGGKGGGEGEGAGSGSGGNGGKGSTPGGDGGDGDGSPARIGADGKGSSGGGSSGEQPVHIGAGDKPNNQDPDIWCRGTGCGGSGSEKPDPVALGTKGTKGIDLAASPKEGTDYNKDGRYNNYKFEKQEDAEGADDSIPALGLEKNYGFEPEESFTTYHIQAKGKSVDPVAKISYGRVTKDGKEYLAIVAHDRHAEYDGNRYKLKDNGDNEKNADGTLVPNPDASTKAVPVAQLVYKGAEEAKMLDRPVEKVFLVSENVINDAAKVIIPDALKAVGKGDATGPVVFKNGAAGKEGEQFKILAGLDNNYSYLNTVGRNPGFFKDYKLDSITVVWGDSKAMNMEFHKA